MDLIEEYLGIIEENEVHYNESKLSAEENFQVSNKLKLNYFDIYSKAPFSYFIIDKKGIIKEVNHLGADELGFQKKNIIKKHFTDFISSNCRNLFYNALDHTFQSKSKQNFEIKIIRKGMGAFWAKAALIFIPDIDMFGLTILDIDESVKDKEGLEKSLEEKEMLIREVNHRVKNNMQVISSLLSLQSRYVDKEALDVYKESQNRVRSMALVHEKLCNSKDLKSVNLKEYIENLVYNLSISYGNPFIEFKIDVDSILLDSDTVIPLGLIINEIVSNSIKYAFPNGLGTVKISLHENSDKSKLIIEDDGIGLPEDVDLENTDSLGLRLINNLSTQIGASVDIYRNKGTKFEINF